MKRDRHKIAAHSIINASTTRVGKSGISIIKIIDAYKTKVLSFPYHFALFTESVFRIVIYPKSAMMNSFAQNNATSHNIFGYFKERHIMSVPCVSLSAIGSRIFPKSDIILHFLAIIPSATSVSPDKIIIAVAAR